MISNLWLFVIFAHVCNGQSGFRSTNSFRRQDSRQGYVRGEYGSRGPPSQRPDIYEGGQPQPHYERRGRGRDPPYEHTQHRPRYSRERVLSHQGRRPRVDFDNVFAGRYEQFGRPPRRHIQSRPSTRRQNRRPSRPHIQRRPRQRAREVVRVGYIGARGGVNFFPFMGGYCAGEMCRDGGLGAGVGDGIGSGSKAQFERRRQLRQNEDVRLYEMHVGGRTS